MANKDDKVKKKKTFFKDFKAELKRVTWPTPKQLVNSTVGVIVITLIVAVIVFILDLAFDSINKYGINGLKNIVEKNNTVVVDEVAEGSENDEAIDENVENEEISEDTGEETVEEQENEETIDEENIESEAIDTTVE